MTAHSAFREPTRSAFTPRSSYSLFPAGASARRPLNQPRRSSLYTCAEDSDNKTPTNGENDDEDDDDCEVKTNSTSSLYHYRSQGDDSPELDQPSRASDKAWGHNRTPVTSTPTPPRSPERSDWPLPVSPKTRHALPVSPDEDSFSDVEPTSFFTLSDDDYDDLNTPRAVTASFAIQPVSAPASGWRVPIGSSPTSPQSTPGLGPSASSSIYSLPLRSRSTATTPRANSGPHLANSYRAPSFASSSWEPPDPHPGTLVDPSQIDEADGRNHPSRPDTAASTYSKSFNSFAPARKLSLPAGFTVTSVEDYFPKTSNSFAGFCKCAWRLQTLQAEKSFAIRNVLPKGATPSSAKGAPKLSTLKCKKCSFEGALPEGKTSQAMVAANVAPLVEYAFRADRVPRSAHGVTYNWTFLFKSHVPVRAVLKKDETMDPVDQTFGCLFCCALGNGTVCFLGAETLCGHIARHHPESVPAGGGKRELDLRVKILVGRAPQAGEDWDIILPGHYQTYQTRGKGRQLSADV